MKRFMLTVVLTCFLSVSVLAGESPTCGIVAVPPPSDSGDKATTTDESTESGELSELLTTVVLGIITWR